MSTLQTFYVGRVLAYCSGGATNGTLPPSESSNDAGGKSRGRLYLASKATFVTDIAVHNRHTSDAQLMIAQTLGGVYYNPGDLTHIRRSPDAGWTIPAGRSLDVMVGRRWSLQEEWGLIALTNTDIFGLSALMIDVVGEWG